MNTIKCNARTSSPESLSGSKWRPSLLMDLSSSSSKLPPMVGLGPREVLIGRLLISRPAIGSSHALSHRHQHGGPAQQRIFHLTRRVKRAKHILKTTRLGILNIYNAIHSGFYSRPARQKTKTTALRTWTPARAQPRVQAPAQVRAGTPTQA